MRDQPQTKLGRAAAAQSAPEPSKFVKAIAGARVLVPFKIPRLDVDAVMTIVPHHRQLVIESEVIDLLERQLKIPLNATTELDYEAERAARHLAEAALDPDMVKRDEYVPIGDVGDWRSLDRNIVGECWRLYLGVVSAYDPISQPLSQEEIDIIEETIKKKAEDPALCLRYLRTFGVTRLSSYLLHSADRLFPSPTPTSSPSESAPD